MSMAAQIYLERFLLIENAISVREHNSTFLSLLFAYQKYT